MAQGVKTLAAKSKKPRFKALAPTEKLGKARMPITLGGDSAHAGGSWELVSQAASQKQSSGSVGDSVSRNRKAIKPIQCNF